MQIMQPSYVANPENNLGLQQWIERSEVAEVIERTIDVRISLHALAHSLAILAKHVFSTPSQRRT